MPQNREGRENKEVVKVGLEGRGKVKRWSCRGNRAQMHECCTRQVHAACYSSIFRQVRLVEGR